MFKRWGIKSDLPISPLLALSAASILHDSGSYQSTSLDGRKIEVDERRGVTLSRQGGCDGSEKRGQVVCGALAPLIYMRP